MLVFSLLGIALTLGALLSAVLIKRESGNAHALLKERARRVFELERTQARAVPAHLVRKLSLAIEFHDDNGAAQLLETIERSL